MKKLYYVTPNGRVDMFKFVSRVCLAGFMIGAIGGIYGIC